MKLTIKTIYVSLSCIMLLSVLYVLLFYNKNYISEYFGVQQIDDPKIQTLRDLIRPIYPHIDDVNIFKGDKSYTIDKHTIYLCLYDENSKYYPDNFLIYVLLHELAHYDNKYDIGHTKKWRNIFDNFLQQAIKNKIWNPDPKLMIHDYCPGEEKSSIIKTIFNNLF